MSEFSIVVNRLKTNKLPCNYPVTRIQDDYTSDYRGNYAAKTLYFKPKKSHYDYTEKP